MARKLHLSIAFFLSFIPVFRTRVWLLREPLKDIPVYSRVTGHSSSERMRKEHSIIKWLIVVTAFSATLRTMDRVERSVLAADSDPLAFKQAFVSDFNGLAVTGAIIAQVAITALALPHLSEVHWTAQGAFTTSLVFGCLSVFFSTRVQRMLTGLSTADDVRDWLGKPAPKAAYIEFEETIKQRLIRARASSAGEERELVKREIVHFLQEHRWKHASFYSCAILSTPPELLNSSMGAFLTGLGIYLGSVWAKDLDPVGGKTATRAILICYIVVAVLGLARFFWADHGKEAETAAVKRWIKMLEADPGPTIENDDIEQGANSGPCEVRPQQQCRTSNGDEAAESHTLASSS
jgi:hypothetical protein